MSSPYRMCTRCIMDTSDRDIMFDPDGHCQYCALFDYLVQAILPPPEEREQRLERLVDDMRRGGRGREYDCIVGVSGGVDSTYTVHLLRQLGLRPLAVHMDNGWNSNRAVTNIERTLKAADVDLHTEVLNWDEFRDLQLAFLRASTPDCEIPTDHAIEAVLMRVARHERIQHVILGSNVVTEAIMPRSWSYGIRDWRYIADVHRCFGTVPLRTYPHFTLSQMVSFQTVFRHRYVFLLNYVDYVKEDATRLIREQLGWEDYGGKHHESVYTRFFQSYILPRKFGADKRRAHLSTLVCAGQLTRSEALAAIEHPACPPELLRQDRDFVIKKLSITEAEFERIMALPTRRFEDYGSYEKSLLFQAMRFAYRLPRQLRANRSNSKAARSAAVPSVAR
jgi:N-acetyl sugar amidotransferase